MCVQKRNLIIGLCGESKVGKTSVAELLAARLNLEARHCGEIVKERAKQLEIDPSAFPREEHNAIDAETKRIAATADRSVVMDGRFLDQVLAGIPNVLIIRLECSDAERLRRAGGKSNIATVDGLLSVKAKDSGEKHHVNMPQTLDRVVIDTTEQTLQQTVEEVLRVVERFHDPAK